MNFNTLLLLSSFCFLENFYANAVNSKDVISRLGTRTPYRFKYNKNDTTIKYPSCKESKIWMVIRHGTRLPSNDGIFGINTVLTKLKNKILQHYKDGKGELKQDEIVKFDVWNKTIDAEQEKFLTFEGQDEMVLLAERMHRRFPNIIQNKYNNKTFLFRYTATERAQQSARYFTMGLFDKENSQRVVYAPATKVDLVLRFYKHCDKWQKQVKHNATTYEEQMLFGKSKIMNNTLEAVSRRLGFDYVLSLDAVMLMYAVCGFETAWDKHAVSPWCYAFDGVDAEVFEYFWDLKHYWQDGYGYELSYKLACMLIKNMFENLMSDDDPQATFLFAHSGTLLKVLSHLQLYRPLSHLKGDQIQKSRTWRTTDIDCFGTNLAFVLYRCKDGDRVLTLHQERIVKLPMCEEELCPLEVLKKHFHESIFNCDFDKMCSIRDDNNNIIL